MPGGERQYDKREQYEIRLVTRLQRYVICDEQEKGKNVLDNRQRTAINKGHMSRGTVRRPRRSA